LYTKKQKNLLRLPFGFILFFYKKKEQKVKTKCSFAAKQIFLPFGFYQKVKTKI